MAVAKVKKRNMYSGRRILLDRLMMVWMMFLFFSVTACDAPAMKNITGISKSMADSSGSVPTANQYVV